MKKDTFLSTSSWKLFFLCLLLSIIGLIFRGDYAVTVPGLGSAGGKFTAGTAGTAIAGTFALTVHLGG